MWILGLKGLYMKLWSSSLPLYCIVGTGVAADTAAGRIMELSKKNRELTAELESERNKLRQMSKKAKDMEKEVSVHETYFCKYQGTYNL